MDPKKCTGAKTTLIVASLLLGILTWFVGAFDIVKEKKMVPVGGGCRYNARQVEKLKNTLKFKPNGALKSIPLGFLVAFLYPIIAAWIIKFCEVLKVWAYRGECEKWDEETKLILAAFCPLTLVSCIIIYSFLATIHRVF